MIVACVRTGDKYPVQYVYRLKEMVKKHLPFEHRFVCFTDRPNDLIPSGVRSVDISDTGLRSWWGKMVLFSHQWRRDERVLYFDLDSVIVGDLSPLAELDIDFGICSNFTRAAGITDWPCKYGSCVMSIGPGFDGSLFTRFWEDRWKIMDRAGKYGDQKAIEELAPDAVLLQPSLPVNFFLGYRDLEKYREAPPNGCSLVIFAGKAKPHNTNIRWVKAAWASSALR